MAGEADVGEVTLGAAGFRAAVVVVEVVGFGLDEAAAEVELDKFDVRRAVVPKVEVRRFSSSDPEGGARLVDAGPVTDERLAAVDVVAGRVGGLVSPPVAAPVRVAELDVGFVAEEVVAGRRAALVVVAGFLAAVPVAVLDAAPAAFFTGAAVVDEDLGFCVGTSAGGSAATGASTEVASVGASAEV